MSADLQKQLNEATWEVAQWPKWKTSIDPLDLSTYEDYEVFWRNGERWLRRRDEEIRMADLAPELEQKWIDQHVKIAHELGMRFPKRRKK